MKLISLSEVEQQVRECRPEIYYIEEGRVLSPAAKDFLNRELIRFDIEKKRKQNEIDAARRKQKTIEAGKNAAPATEKETAVETVRVPKGNAAPGAAKAASAMGSAVSASNTEKPEHMTHRRKGELVPKSDPVIVFRGKLDQFQSVLIWAATEISAASPSSKALSDLEDILAAARAIMRAEVMGEILNIRPLLGFDHAQLRARSHDPNKYYGLEPMELPCYTFGKAYALLNVLRSCVREVEISAVTAFCDGGQTGRSDIIEELNMISSALHIMMCKCRTGEYDA